MRNEMMDINMFGTLTPKERFAELIIKERMTQGLPVENGWGAGEMLATLLVCILVASICACVGMFIGRTRGRGASGFWLGLFLGPIGWIITLLLPREGRRCPFCREVVADDATACPHCQREIPSPRGAPPSRTYASPKAQKMEKVIVSCPSCQARFKVQKSKVGPCFRCLKCGARFKPAPEA